MTNNVENCPLCEGENFKTLFEGRDRLHGLPGIFYVNKCLECNVIFTSPTLDWLEVKKYYPEEYETFLQKKEPLLNRIITDWGVKRKINIVNKYNNGGSLLDIGCSKGEFLYHLNLSRKWELYGVEQDSLAASLAANIPGVKIYNSRLEDIEFGENVFDVITMWHVFEHLPFPQKTLSTLRRIIKPNGVLILALPNVDSINARVFGRYWSGYDLPRHYFTYSAPVIRKLLLDNGFRIVDGLKFIGEYNSFRYSMFFLLDEIIENYHLRLLLKKVVNNLFFRIFMTPYFLLANALKRGSTMVVVAKKI